MEPTYAAVINSFVLFLIAILTAYTTYISHRTEVNTNSMKDALILSTNKVSHAEGKAEGIQETTDKALDKANIVADKIINASTNKIS